MLDLVLLTVGKIKNKNLDLLAKEYQQRISPFARLEIIEVKASSFGHNNQEKTKKEEANRLTEIIAKKSAAQVFLLAEEGKSYDSRSLALDLAKINGQIILVIAGALGWEKAFKESYQKISLSTLTMPHELARVVVLEQLYRAALILAAKEYHY